jgi:Fe-S cluster assembly ATP-binding protein
MAMLEPKLAILDETDSGLDIDALNCFQWGNKLKAIKRHHSYYTIKDYWIISFLILHVLYDGKIVKTGGKVAN